MHTPENIQLVARAKAGDKTAFSELYDKFIKPIYTFIYYKTHHKETAEDITSQVFMRAYNNLKSFDQDKGTFSAWIYRIARNAVIDHYRSARPTTDIEDVWDLVGKEDIERDAHARIELAKVEIYLKELPAEQRDIVIMRVWQEMSYAEISEALGKSETSCKMMFSRTVATLRETMPLPVLLIFLFGAESIIR